jgi:hypothetical protein
MLCTYGTCQPLRNSTIFPATQGRSTRFPFTRLSPSLEVLAVTSKFISGNYKGVIFFRSVKASSFGFSASKKALGLSPYELNLV